MIKGLRRSGQRRPQANGKTVALLLDQLAQLLLRKRFELLIPDSSLSWDFLFDFNPQFPRKAKSVPAVRPGRRVL
jgi:hypothetical protein